VGVEFGGGWLGDGGGGVGVGVVLWGWVVGGESDCLVLWRGWGV